MVVEYEGVDDGGGSGKSVKSRETSKAWKICKNPRFGGTKLPDLRH